jgi:hypothetical protein
MCFYELLQRSKHSLLVPLVHFLDMSLGGPNASRNHFLSSLHP